MIVGDDGKPLTFQAYLHALWVSAGCPSARRIAEFTDVSHNTANQMVRRGVVPNWSKARTVLEFLGADMALAAELWAAASPVVAAAEGPPKPIPERLDRLEAAVLRVSEQLEEVLRRLPGS